MQLKYTTQEIMFLTFPIISFSLPILAINVVQRISCFCFPSRWGVDWYPNRVHRLT